MLTLLSSCEKSFLFNINILVRKLIINFMLIVENTKTVEPFKEHVKYKMIFNYDIISELLYF